MINEINSLKNVKRLTGSACLALALFAPTVVAQEVKSALEVKKQARQEKLDKEKEAIETIEVSGTRASLESALFTKRSANTIVDAISSEDIANLPALDLGEALQAIPGVQVNRESERRESKINLRGLPGGFVKVTANNQSFATPTRSSSPQGSSNPFGAFESAVFDGVTVVKAVTADRQAGGISGIVDKKLSKALSRPERARFNLSLGTRYEQLNDSFDEQFAFAGSQHLIKDKLAYAFKIAGSEQNFRRDSILTRKYTALNSVVFPEFNDWKEANGLNVEDIVRVPNEVRQLIEYNSGDRLSFTGNIEWKPTEDLKLGTNLLYSKRKMDDNKFEQIQAVADISTDISRQKAGVFVTPTSAPYFAGLGDNGENVYSVQNVDMQGVTYLPGNRIFNMGEETKGIFLYADYMTNDWEIGGVISYSEAESLFNQTGIDARLKADTNKNPTGVTSTIHTGGGNLDDFLFTIEGWENLDLDQKFVHPTLTGTTVGRYQTSLNAPDFDKAQGFYVLGAVDNPQRTMESAELNVKRYVEFSVFDDSFQIESVKAGARYQLETLDNRVQQNSPAGINVDNISNDILLDNPIYTGSTDYFNGKLPGYNKPLEGWQTFDVEGAVQALQWGMDLHEGAVLIPESGFIRKEHRYTGENIEFAKNFSVEQETLAAYFMANFVGEIGDVFYSGNFGLRYVETNNDIAGLSYNQRYEYSPKLDLDGNQELDADGNPATTRELTYKITDEYVDNSYNYLLPSLNIAAEITDDIVIRAAYSEGFVRPNLRAQNPSTLFEESDSRTRVDLQGSAVKPYEADMYDLSIEWYNRKGSVISAGIFQKDIYGSFKRRELCPEGPNAAEAYGITEELYQVEREGGGFDCYSTEFDNNGNARQVDIREYYNGEEDISVLGYEFIVQQKLDFLPYPWNGFGGQVNFSYVDNDRGEVELYGISTTSYNLIGYYENDGLNIRLSYNYRNAYESEGGNSFGGLDNKNTEERGQLDMSARYRITKNLSVSLRGYNLTDVIYKEYILDDPRAISRINYDGRTYSASINYNF
ncbi:TonB-dependent receptor [Paraglaciecola aquimarina]|uniref:TonB-dependent receptor n=1 Tax=Paraglaciecola algarum TaxID=3050085 RepID=A0ABS9D8Z2_9ALTE|nr:TonB-dependent receptor [Paraglaciecola sp. G1-23]MCF2948857.1 TonB-dependent receptor [Paraglaciecola sp. G1-23]